MKMLFIERTPAQKKLHFYQFPPQVRKWSGTESTGERVGSGRWRPPPPGRACGARHWPAHLNDSLICGHFQTESTWKESFFLTYNLLNDTYFFSHRILYRLYKRLYLEFHLKQTTNAGVIPLKVFSIVCYAMWVIWDGHTGFLWRRAVTQWADDSRAKFTSPHICDDSLHA